MTPKRPSRSLRPFFVLCAAVAFFGLAAFAYSDQVLSIGARLAAAANLSEEQQKTPAEPRDDTAKKRSKNLFDDDRIVFASGNLPLSFTDRRDGIHVLDPFKGPQALGSVNDFEPAWSPDGSKIAFVSLRDGLTRTYEDRVESRGLYLMNPDGTNQMRVYTPHFGGEAQPAFSPDGQELVYVADYSPGGAESGIWKLDLQTEQATHLMYSGDCLYQEERAHPRKRPVTPDSEFYPGIFGADTPNFSPDGQYIIFGDYGDSGVNVYRMNTDGSGCQMLYESQGSWYATQARYSPDGTKIALFHREDIIMGRPEGASTTRILRIIDANSGQVLQDIIEPTNFRGWPVWSPDGSKIAYFGGTAVPGGSDTAFQEIWTIDLDTETVNQEFVQGVPEGLRGMSWGVPATAVPELTLRINNLPVMSGTSTTGTVYFNAPVPPGGATVQLQALGAIGAITLPQSSVTILPGQTQADFTINTQISTFFRSGEILASWNFNYAEATVSMSPTRPDLTVSNFTGPAASVEPGQSFPLSWVTQNIGAMTTGGGFIEGVYFSHDAVLDAGDGSAIRTLSNTTLAPGEQRTTNTTAAIPGSRVPADGDYYLILQTNVGRTHDEGGAYANNTIAIPVHVGLPDVVIENIVVPAVVEPSVSHNISWTVRNTGAAGTGPSDFTNAIYFSMDDIAGNEDDISLSSVTGGPLAAGASVVQNRNITIPTLPVRPTGQAFFYVKADVFNSVAEGLSTGPGETNNITFKSVQFEYNVPDLQITSTTSPIEVETDTDFALEWTTANTGNRGTGTFSDRVYFSTDAAVGSDIQLGSFSLTGGVTAGASVDRIQNVKIPTSAIPASGNYFVYVKADAATQVDEGENEENNIRFHPVYVRRLLRPDLTVSNVTAPPTAFFDQTIQVQWTVTNAGQGPTNAATWNDAVYIGTSPTDLSARQLRVANTTALEAGGSYIATATMKIPRGLSGTYYIKVKADEGADVNEESTTNNLASSQIQINVPPLPDLTVSNVQAPVGLVFAGTQFQMTWQVNNVGTADANVDPGHAWRDRIYLSRDQILNTSEDRLIFTSAGATHLAQGANRTHSTYIRELNGVAEYVKLPNDVEGEYYVFAVTDTHGGVYEYNNETNNFDHDRIAPGSPINIQRTPPDLTLTSPLTGPAAASGGESIQVAFTVANQGAFSASGSWHDGVYLSADTTLDAGDTFVGSARRNGGLSPGGQYAAEAELKIPNCVSGNYYLIAKTDYNNAIYEFSGSHDAEANNASAPKPITITTNPPDLRVSNIDVSPMTFVGQSGTVSWTLTNHGTGPAVGPWHERVRLRRVGGPPTITLASLSPSGTIAPGGSIQQSVNFTLPSTLLPGEYYISIETDIYDVVPECGGAEDNNTGVSGNFDLAHNNPDLVVDSVTVSPSASGSEHRLIQWTVRNAGAQPANSSGWRDRVIISADTTYSGGDVVLTNALSPVVQLAPGATYSASYDAPIGNIPAGNYFALVHADHGGHVAEGPNGSQWETNNLNASAQFSTAGPGADLSVSPITVSAPVYTGGSVTVDFTVSNTGTSPTFTGSWSDYIILSRDSVFDPADRLIGYVSRSGLPLAGGESYQVSKAVNIPNGLAGEYRIFVITDYSKHIAESVENNNQSAPFNVLLEPAPPADLSVTNITPPATATPGESAVFTWTVQNMGPNVAVGKWIDNVYLSRDQFLDAGDSLVAQTQRSDALLNVTGTYTVTHGLRLPAIEEGTYYVIVRSDARNLVREGDEANNIYTSPLPTEVSMLQLAMNTPLQTMLGNGATKFFKFTPGADETVVVEADGQAGNKNDLFTNFGSMVSRADYDYQSLLPNRPEQENFIANTSDGPYYSMVSHDYIPPTFPVITSQSSNREAVKDPRLKAPEADQNITLTASILPFTARSVSPTSAGNGGVATLAVTGAKFQSGTTVKLVAPNGSQTASSQNWSAPVRIIAVFDLKGKAPGLYDVVVTNPGGATSTIVDGFEVLSGGGHNLRPAIVGPPSLGFGSRFIRYTFSAANDGLNDAVSVPIIVSVPEGMEYRMDPATYSEGVLDTEGFEIPEGTNAQEDMVLHVDENGIRSILLVAPLVRARSAVNIGIDLKVPAFAPFDVSVEVLPPLADLADDNAEAAPPANRAGGTTINGRFVAETAAQQSARCWREFMRQMLITILKGIIPFNCLGSVLNGLLNMVDFASDMALNPNQDPWVVAGKLTMLVANKIGHMAAFCLSDGAKKIPWYLAGVLAVQTAKLLYQLNECLKRDEELGVSRPTSNDPNEKHGPEGFGPERWIASGQTLLYRINFENLPEALAPAQRVLVIDDLPAELDAGSVRLSEIGFGHERTVAPPNQALHQTRMLVGEGDAALYADISAGLDVVNNRVIWLISTIDPATGERPLDPYKGLLPPNNENRDGEGYVTFTVKARAGLPTGTQISNKATIYFDENEPIVTNAYSNVLDSGVPSSAIDPVAPVSDTPSIPLNWTGSDDTNGSGLKGFDIYVSEDGGQYVPIEFETNALGMVYEGRWGKSYSFYSIAKDNAGNIEAVPPAPDAVVTVLGGDSEGDVAPRPNGQDGQVSIGDVTQIRRFVSGLDSDYLYNEYQRVDTAPYAERGDGILSSGDVIQARRYAAGLDVVAEAFGPNAPSAPAMPAAAVPEGAARVVRPLALSRVENKLKIAVEIDAVGDEVGIGFTLNFDPSVLSNPSGVVRGSGADNTGLTVNTLQAAAGRVGILLDKDPNEPFSAGLQQLVVIEFDVAPGAPATTNVSFGSVPIFQEIVNGLALPLPAAFTAALVPTNLAPTAGEAEVSGRVLTAAGQPVSKAEVTVTDTSGVRRRASTNGFGFYKIEGLPAGRMYLIQAAAKNRTYAPRSIMIMDNLANLDLIEESP